MTDLLPDGAKKKSPLRAHAAREERRFPSQAKREMPRAAVELFRACFGRSPDGIVLIDRQGRILEWNEGEKRLTGIPRSEALQRPIWEIQHRLAPPERRNADFLRLEREKFFGGLREGAGLRRILDEEIQRSDGTRRKLQSVLFVIRLDEDLFAARMSRDVTKRARPRAKPRSGAQRPSLALEASGHGLWDWDIAADTAYLSPEYLRLSGYTEPHVSSAFSFFRSTVHPEDLRVVETTIEEHFRGNTARSVVQYRLRKASGEYAWMRGIGKVTARDESGAPIRMTGILADITESKRLEEDLRERQELLLQAEGLVHLGHCDLDLRSGRSHWSDETFRILGYDPGSVPPSTKAFLRAIVPKDRRRVVEAIRTTARDGTTCQAEYRVSSAERGTRYVLGTFGTLRDPGDAPERIIGTAQDITERKLTELALAEANQRKDDQLRELVLQLQQAENQERQRIAQILHDDLQQLLVATRLQLEGLAERADDASVRESVSGISELLQQAVDASRSLSHELVPPSVVRNDLLSATQWLARQTQQHHGLTVEVLPQADLGPTSETARNIVFRAIRELLFNVVKHAGVKSASVRIQKVAPDELCVEVTDRGKGFEPTGASGDVDAGSGLAGSRERLALIGGRIEIETQPGKGTTARIFAPLGERY